MKKKNNMKTTNHECYVSLETAKLLKKAGFDWECRRFYDCTNSDCIRYEEYSAPTLSVAQRWLLEVKHIWCEITICFVMEDALMKTKYHVQCISTDYNETEMIDCHNIETDTSEEALEAGIQKCLEIILEK